MDLSSRVAVVTGGTAGIGLAVARALGARGARVAICGRTPERVAAAVGRLRAGGATVDGRACDVGDADGVTAFASWTRATVGDPEILVNNAGIARFGRLEDLTVDDWDAVIATNVRSLYLVTREFLPAMKRAGRGDVVNIVSLAGRNGFAGGTAYVASKHAALGFSKALLLETRAAGIRVMAICPGSVDTAFFDGQDLLHPARERILKPEDVADTVVAALTLDRRATLSELDVRPANP